MKAIRYIQLLILAICALSANGQTSYLIRVDNDSLKPYSDEEIYTLDEEFNNFMSKYAVKSYKQAYTGPGPAVYRLQSDSTIAEEAFSPFTTKGIWIVEIEQNQQNPYKSSYLIKVETEEMKPVDNGIFTQNEEFNTILEIYKANVYRQWIPNIQNEWLKDVYLLQTEIELPIEFLNVFIGNGFSLVEKDEWEPHTLGLEINTSKLGNPLIYSTNKHSIGLNIPYETKTAEVHIYGIQGRLIHSQKITDRGNSIIELGNKVPTGTYFCILLCDGKVAVTKQIAITD